MIPGTEHPEPTINGIKHSPLNPNFLNSLSNKNVILAMYPVVSRIDIHKNRIISSAKKRNSFLLRFFVLF